MASGTLTDRLRETLTLFAVEGEPLTTTEVTSSLDVGRRSTYERLETLVEHDRLMTKKVGASARVWWRPSTKPSGKTPDWSAPAESLIDTVLDDAAVGIFVLDENFEVAWINEAIEQYFGLDRREVHGRDKRALLNEHIASIITDADAFAETVLATYDENTYTERFECRVTAGDGRESRWLEHRSKPIDDGEYAGGRVELYYDITDRKRQLREEKAFTESILDTQSDIIYAFDTDEGFIRWNDRFNEVTGYTDTEIQAMQPAEVIADDAADELAEAIEQVIEQRNSVTVELPLETKDGEEIPYRFTGGPITSDGTVTGITGIGRDISDEKTRQRRLERQRDELEAELGDIFERVDDAFYALDDEMRFVALNDRAEDLLGHTESELLGRTVWEALSVAEDDSIRERFQNALETQTATSFDRYSESLDIWEIVRVYPSESGLSVYFTDITERKTRERELERYETIVETIWDGVYALDDDDRFVFVNQAFCELVGYERGELLDKHSTLVNSETVNEAANALEAEMLDGERDVGVLEYGLETASGETVPVETRFGPFEYHAGRYGRCGVARDISQRKQRERELKRFEQAVESSGHAIYMTDADGEITYVNSQFEEMTRYDESEAVGKTPAILNSGHHDEAYFRELWEAVTAGNVWEEEIIDRRADGSLYQAQQTIAPVTDDDGDIDRFVAIQSDITDRKERQQALRDRIRQQEVVADLGQYALDEGDLDGLLADGAELLADTLDNDYCKVLDLDEGSEELSLRQGFGWDDGIVGSATVSATEDDSQAAYTLESDGPVRVSDLETDTRFSGPELLTSHDVRSGVSVIIGPNDDPWGILGIHDTDPREFSEQDTAFVQAVANILANAIAQYEYEQELIQQRERLAALNTLNQVVQEITAAVIEQSTREEIEEAVCERLAATDSYLFAWIGEVDLASQTVTPRTEAGVEGYLDGITISADPKDARSEGPTGRALKTGETQVTHDIRADSRHDPWRESIEQYGFRSSIAIPIAHEDTIYGVLNVYADRLHAFEGQERAVTSQLGKIVGHAIAATERKQALLSDELVELDFEIKDMFAAGGGPVETSGTITFDQAISVKDGEFLVYGTATQDALDTMNGLVEALPHWESFTVLTEDEPVRFELRLINPPILSVVTSHGGYIEDADIIDGTYRMTIHLAPTTDVRQITTAVQEAYPDAELLRRRQVTRTHDDLQPFQRRLVTDLTDRQRATLKAAYHAGFFEWPRNVSGEDVANSLDVAPPTFHQHLRKGERKVFDAIFSSSTQNAA